MKNLKWLEYTLKHRRAFSYCVDKLIKEPVLHEEMKKRAKVHDMDKMVMYLYLEQRDAQKIHISTMSHHLENNLPKTYEDYVEAVIDYECAPYTKPDKPLNAYGLTRYLLKNNYLDEERGKILMDIIETLGIASKTSASEDKEGISYIQKLGNISEDTILNEIEEYKHNFSEEYASVMNSVKDIE